MTFHEEVSCLPRVQFSGRSHSVEVVPELEFRKIHPESHDTRAAPVPQVSVEGAEWLQNTQVLFHRRMDCSWVGCIGVQ